MTGLVETRRGTFAFRDDHGFESSFWAWNIHDDPGPAGKLGTHKWKKLPRGVVTFFDLDDPPLTVSYITTLSIKR